MEADEKFGICQQKAYMLPETGVLEPSGLGKGAQGSALVTNAEFKQGDKSHLRPAASCSECLGSSQLLCPWQWLPSLQLPEAAVLTHMDSASQWAALLPALMMLVRSPQPLYTSRRILWGKVNTISQNPQRHQDHSPVKFSPHQCLLHFFSLAIGYCTMSYFHMTGLATQSRVIFLNPKVTARYSATPHSIGWGLAGCRAGLKGPKRFHSWLVPPFCLPVNVFLQLV